MDSIHKVAIVVPSCDKYSDLWGALFQTLRRQWKYCPFQIYLLTNHIDYIDDGVATVKIGDDQSWSANLIRALKLIPQDYVFLFIDDLFLSSSVDEKRVRNLVERCVSQNWDYLRLNPTPGPARAQLIDSSVGQILPGDLYRPSTVLSIWRKDVLLDVLDPNESAWEFEVYGGARTDKYEQWYASKNWNLPYHNLVIKGKIDPIALCKIKLSGADIATDRPVMNYIESLLLILRRLRHSLFYKAIPRNTRRKIRSFFDAA